MDLSFDRKRICTDCGQEVERGLIMTIEHDSICKRNAPNESIESYWHIKKLNNLVKTYNDKFDAVSGRMNNLEMNEYLYFMTFGISCGNNVLGFGSTMMDKITEFKNRIINKYS